MPQRLLVKIETVPNHHVEEGHVLYTEVASIVQLPEPGVTRYKLTDCELSVDAFRGFPVSGQVVRHSNGRTILHCEWAEENEDGLNYTQCDCTIQQIDAFHL